MRPALSHIMRAFLTFLLILWASAGLADERVHAFAKSVLAQLQPLSIAQNREYCGTIGIQSDGTLVASKPHRGGRNGCRPRRARKVDRILASYHTHGAFSPNADSELPSVRDVLSDMNADTDGYVSTPGGRFWYVNGRDGWIQQLCPLGCLPADPAFERYVWGVIQPFYTLQALKAREDF